MRQLVDSDILIFTDNPGVHETRLVLEEAVQRGLRVATRAPWDLTIPQSQEFRMSLVYVPSNMLHRGTTFELVNRFILLEQLARVAPMVNPLMTLLRYSKEQLTLMSPAKYPHPRTLVTESIDNAHKFASEILDQGRDVVIKPICRARGVGVTLLSAIRKREDLLQFLSWYIRSQGEGVFYLQEYIPNVGYDVRVFVVDGEVVGRMKRSNPQDFRYNASIGGVAEPYEQPIYDELAIRVADTMGLMVTGVDVLPSKDGTPYILEANCYPGYSHLMTATGLQIHKKIVDLFTRMIRK